jgi:quinol monooxygenase YgiN
MSWSETLMITAIAIQSVTEGMETQLIQLMTNLTHEVRANEPGCTEFLYVKSTDKKQTYVVIEQYKDSAAYEFHQHTAYLASFIPQMMKCLNSAPEVITCTDVFRS